MHSTHIKMQRNKLRSPLSHITLHMLQQRVEILVADHCFFLFFSPSMLPFISMPSAPWLSPLITVCSNLCEVMRETCFSPLVVTQTCLRVALYLLGTARRKCQLCLPFRMTFFAFACGMGVGELLIHSVQHFWSQSGFHVHPQHKYSAISQRGMESFVMLFN